MSHIFFNPRIRCRVFKTQKNISQILRFNNFILCRVFEVPVLQKFPLRNQMELVSHCWDPLCRQRSIFQGSSNLSIVGTCELNYRVWNENGWILTTIAPDGCQKQTLRLPMVIYVFCVAALPCESFVQSEIVSPVTSRCTFTRLVPSPSPLMTTSLSPPVSLREPSTPIGSAFPRRS